MKNDSTILKGVTESCLTKDENGNLKMKLKFQFGDLSHNEKKDCRFQLCLYTPSDLLRPILVLQSTCFKIYARRTGNVEKRSREEIKLVTNKKIKSTSLDDYMKTLEDLVQFKNKLSGKEQILANELLKGLVPEKQDNMDDLFYEFDKETHYDGFESKEFEDLFNLM